MRFDRFHKADIDLTQPPPLLHLRIYLCAESDGVNKVLDRRQSEVQILAVVEALIAHHGRR